MAFAQALTLVRPVSRRRLYWTARGVFVSDRTQARAFDAVFDEVFGDPAGEVGEDAPLTPRPDTDPRRPRPPAPRAPATASRTSAATPRPPRAADGPETTTRRRSRCRWPWRATRSGSPAEELRRSRAARARPGPEADDGHRAGHAAAPHAAPRGEPARQAGRSAAHAARQPPPEATSRSGWRAGRGACNRGGSSCCATSRARWSPMRAPTSSSSRAAGSGPNAEAFVFATRLTRVTRALQARDTRTARYSARPPPRPTGRAARASATR